MLKSARYRVFIPLILALMLVVGLVAAFAERHSNNTFAAVSRVTIEGATRYQSIDGFGISEAFDMAHDDLAIPFLTNAASNTAGQAPLPVHQGLSARLCPRALVYIYHPAIDATLTLSSPRPPIVPDARVICEQGTIDGAYSISSYSPLQSKPG